MSLITHAKVSTIVDDAAAVAAGEVVPSDWNAAHAIAQILRSDIPNHKLSGDVITLGGYRTFGDLGAGAKYTSRGATANGILAIQDAGGTWWNLFVDANDTINVGWFGAYADWISGTAVPHPLSAGDMAANAWWRGTYAAGMSWDYVAVQEAIHAAFAYGESTPGHVIWNNGTLSARFTWPSRKLFVPGGANVTGSTGYYAIDQTIQFQISGFEVEFDSRQTGAAWIWIGPTSSVMFNCDSAVYGVFRNVNVGSSQDSNPGDAPLWRLDHTGTGQTFLKTQQITIESCIVSCGQNGNGIDISVSGGSAQGDTIVFINPGFFGFRSDTALFLGGSNCLGIVLLGGDIQGYTTGIGGVGQFFAYGTSCQNQNLGGNYFYSPIINQFTRNAADFYMEGGGGSTTCSTIQDCRSESDILAVHLQKFVSVRQASLSGASSLGWTANFSFQLGQTIGNVGTQNRIFMVVDTGGIPEWEDIQPGSTTTVINTNQNYLLNQWAGYELHHRTNAGITEYVDIASNTAGPNSVITLAAALTPLQPGDMYWIGHASGAVAPAWDTVTGGEHSYHPGSGQGFTTTSGSAVVTFPATLGVPVDGSYVVIPNASSITPSVGGITFKQALIAKVVSHAGQNATLSRSATASLADTYGYIGASITDSGGIVQYIDLNFDAINGATSIESFVNTGGHITQSDQMRNLNMGRRDFLNTVIPINQPSTSTTEIANVRYGPVWELMAAQITSSATIDLTNVMFESNSALLVPTTTATLNAPIPFASADTAGTIIGQDFYLIIKTSGTTSYTLTFGANFVTAGTLATGTVSGAYFIVHFRANGSSWIEVSRYPATGGGGGTPGSPANSIQYNNAGNFGGASNLQFFNTGSTAIMGLADGGGILLEWIDNSGTNNIGIGPTAGNLGTVNGSNDISIGSTAGQSLTTGSNNILMGHGAGGNITTGSGNIICGVYGGQATVSNLVVFTDQGGNYKLVIDNHSNSFFGSNAGNFPTTSGTDNCGFGAASLGAVTTGTENVGVGTAALSSLTTGTKNFALGKNALSTLTTEQQNIAIGDSAANSIAASFNICIGSGSMQGSCGDGNTVIGASNAQSFTGGTSIRNVSIGQASMQSVTTGSENTIVGAFSGRNFTTGGNNTIIGYLAGNNYATSESNNVIIGSAAGTVGKSNEVIIADGAGNIRIRHDATDLFIDNSATFLLRALVTLTNNAALNTATLGNAPAAGNPTKWFAIDDNGVTRFVPAW